MQRKPVAPAVAKRMLRAGLRKAREKTDYTQKSIADELFWSQSKIIRIEQGSVPVAPTDVEAMARKYGLAEEGIAELVELAKASRRSDEWAAYRDLLSPAALTLYSYEQAANVVQKYEPSLIPGLFQTKDYAHGLLVALGNSREDVIRRLELRLRRQQLLESDDCPRLDCVIGETALSRPVGGKHVMRSQFEHLRRIMRHRAVTIRLLPFSAGPHRGLGSAFTLLQFDEGFLTDIAFLEGTDKASVTEDDPRAIGRYEERFAELTELSVVGDDVFALLDEVQTRRYAT